MKKQTKASAAFDRAMIKANKELCMAFTLAGEASKAGIITNSERIEAQLVAGMRFDKAVEEAKR